MVGQSYASRYIVGSMGSYRGGNGGLIPDNANATSGTAGSSVPAVVEGSGIVVTGAGSGGGAGGAYRMTGDGGTWTGQGRGAAGGNGQGAAVVVEQGA